MSKVSASQSPLDAYVSRLAARLGTLPDDERRDILMETRSHVTERRDRFPFPSIEEVLEQLGPPEAYARQFLREDRPAVEQGSGSVLHALSQLMQRGWVALPLVLIVTAAYGIALIAFAVGVYKLVSPDDIGVWVWYVDRQRQLVHAGFNAGHGGQEILGYRLTVYAFGVATALGVAASMFLKWVARITKPGES